MTPQQLKNARKQIELAALNLEVLAVEYDEKPNMSLALGGFAEVLKQPITRRQLVQVGKDLGALGERVQEPRFTQALDHLRGAYLTLSR